MPGAVAAVVVEDHQVEVAVVVAQPVGEGADPHGAAVVVSEGRGSVLEVAVGGLLAVAGDSNSYFFMFILVVCKSVIYRYSTLIV